MIVKLLNMPSTYDSITSSTKRLFILDKGIYMVTAGAPLREHILPIRDKCPYFTAHDY